VGCCSLRVEHISLETLNKVTFDFLGKDSMRYFNTVEVLPVVYKAMQLMVVTPTGQPKDPKDDLFEMIDSSKLNDYFKNFMKDLTAKVFRTYNASISLQSQLDGQEGQSKLPLNAQMEAKIKYYNDCNREVAILCNHKKAEPKNLKEQLTKLQSVIDDKKKELKEIEAWKKKLAKEKDAANPKGLPKTVESCAQKASKLKEQIKTKEFDLKNKEDNAQVALSTSKINYMDPRITISWCKQKEVPIEKVFPQTLRRKFAWAMDNDMEWKF